MVHMCFKDDRNRNEGTIEVDALSAFCELGLFGAGVTKTNSRMDLGSNKVHVARKQ